MRLTSIDAARGVAACLVVAFHANGTVKSYFHEFPFGSWFRFGYAGVDFFFVLSGFVIYTIHANDIGKRDRLARVTFRRFSRIFPTYWIVLGILVLVYVAVPSLGEAHHRDWHAIGKSFVLWPMTDLNILAVAWTLSHELLFYALFGVAILNRRIGISLFLLWQFCLIAWNLSGGSVNFLLNLRNIGFLIGILSAALPYKRPLPLVPIGIFFFLATGTFDSLSLVGNENFLLLCYSLSSGLIVYGLRAPEFLTAKIPRIFLFIGEASYSIYLVHLAMVALLAKVFTRIPHLPGSIVFLALICFGVKHWYCFSSSSREAHASSFKSPYKNHGSYCSSCESSKRLRSSLKTLSKAQA
ncbi:MAG: acyltransferase 3 family protein [Acidobacteriales bacterium]|nr:acyltransferase 3 family protein [Terriglobales bacterium]